MGALLGRALGVGGELPTPPGPHAVGSWQGRLGAGRGPLVHAYYPAVTAAPASAPYMREEAAKGFASWLGLRALSFVFTARLPAVKHGLVRNAPALPAAARGGRRFPVLVFSHGLGGNSEMYSALCGDLASHGVVVLAIEHEDGSGSYCHPAGAETALYYKSPPKGMAYVRDSVVEFRAPFLAQRRAEVATVLEALGKRSGLVGDDQLVLENKAAKAGAGAVEPPQGAPQYVQPPPPPNALLEAILESAEPDSVFLGGHSFGGCSSVTNAHHFKEHGIRGIVLLDLWPFPIPDDVVSKGVPQPVLSILTEQFVNNGEVAITKQLLKNSSEVKSFFVPGSTHQQFSDAPYFTSPALGKRIGAAGMTPKETSQQILVDTVRHFLYDQQPPGHELLVPF
jgi:platelet-activating factor acetylhydrolase